MTVHSCSERWTYSDWGTDQVSGCSAWNHRQPHRHAHGQKSFCLNKKTDFLLPNLSPASTLIWAFEFEKYNDKCAGSQKSVDFHHCGRGGGGTHATTVKGAMLIKSAKLRLCRLGMRHARQNYVLPVPIIRDPTQTLHS